MKIKFSGEKHNTTLDIVRMGMDSQHKTYFVAEKIPKSQKGDELIIITCTNSDFVNLNIHGYTVVTEKEFDEIDKTDFIRILENPIYIGDEI